MTTIYGSYQRRCQNELTDIIQALGKQFGFDPIAAVAFINDTQVDEAIRMERPQVAKRKPKVSNAEKAAAKAEKLAAKEALKARDYSKVGQLMLEPHRSLRDDFEVSSTA